MKRVVRIAWSLTASFLLAMALFLILAVPARAPRGGKNSLGGRTIASVQEEEFDRRLLHYHLCYGIRFSADRATVERRRVCKAMLVNRLERMFEQPGRYFRTPVEFHCEDTVFSRAPASESGVSISLQPNREFTAIDQAIQAHMEAENIGESVDRFARDACEFLVDCKQAMRPGSLSLRKLAACFSTGDLTHRKILLDEVGAMLFRAKASQTKILYSNLLEDAHKQ